MIIRKQQFDTLTTSAESGYIEGAVRHLRQYDPLLAAAAGQAGLEQVAGEGLEKARRYNLGSGRELQLYLQLMMSLGSAFDTDPQFAWLHPFLREMEGVGTMERARLLHFHARAYLERAYGDKGEHGQKALERTLQLTRDRLQRAGADFDTSGPKLMEWLHPQRMEYLDSEAIAGLMATARKQAGEAGLPGPEGAVFLFLPMFAFGHRVCADPLHPWLRKELADRDAADSSARMDRLIARTHTYLTMMLRQLKLSSAGSNPR